MGIDAGQLLQTANLVSAAGLRQALAIQTQRGGSLPRICHELGVLDEGRWVAVLTKALKLNAVDLSSMAIDPEARRRCPESLLRQVLAFPFQLRTADHVLLVAMAEPQDDSARAQLRAASGCALKVSVASYGQVEGALDRHPHPAGGAEEFIYATEDFGEGREPGEDPPVDAAVGRGWIPLEAAPESAPPSQPEDRGAATDSTEASARQLRELQAQLDRSTRAFRAALQLSLAKQLFTADALAAKLKPK